MKELEARLTALTVQRQVLENSLLQEQAEVIFFDASGLNDFLNLCT